MEEDAWEGPLQEFRHEELRSNTCVRLIQIHAQLLRGDISCTLRIFESDNPNCPDYAALSYVWGDSTPTHTIYVNGLVHRVHQSLWEFLSHRRMKEDTEHVWIWTDLLCIDQAHHSEKNEQISRMGDIYSQAAYVISWLGSREKTVEAVRTLVKMSEEIDTRCSSKYARDSFESNQIAIAVFRLGKREPYWERVWIVQEVACARHCIVVFGDISVSLEDLLRKMKLAMNRSDYFHEYDIHFGLERIKALADLKTSIQRGETILFSELIDKTLYCQATRNQDKIYGLLGLACRLDPWFDPSALEVSQHKSLFDVWWDIIFMSLDRESDAFMMGVRLHSLELLFDRLSPPRNHWKLEMGSTIRRSYTETASRVSEAAYSESIQAFLGICRKEHDERLRSRRELQQAWRMVTEHVSDHENDVPGLQTRLGWSTWAGIRFTSLSCINEGTTQKLDDFLPSGWLCAAHWPDPLGRTTAKNHIEGYSWQAPPEDRDIPAYCSGAEHDGLRCDLSLVVMRIELLGITCIVTSTETVQIDFYCDCCDPNA